MNFLFTLYIVSSETGYFSWSFSWFSSLPQDLGLPLSVCNVLCVSQSQPVWLCARSEAVEAVGHELCVL
jgi:hypothetical protein